MVIDRFVISTLEKSLGGSIPRELKRYLIATYAQEPFPYEYTEQDLYANIGRDICNYKAGNLDITVKKLSERRREECEYLQALCVEKLREIQILEEYVAELEDMLSQHGLSTARMAEKQRDCF